MEVYNKTFRNTPNSELHNSELAEGSSRCHYWSGYHFLYWGW